jgi:hypothetical protein
MQFAISNASRYVFPYAMVSCGEPDHRDERRLQIMNPVFVAEVLSMATGGFDKWDMLAFLSSFAFLPGNVVCR